MFLLSLAFGGLNFARGDGFTVEVYVMLLLTTPLTGRWMLSVTAQPALKSPPTPANT